MLLFMKIDRAGPGLELQVDITISSLQSIHDLSKTLGRPDVISEGS